MRNRTPSFAFAALMLSVAACSPSTEAPEAPAPSVASDAANLLACPVGTMTAVCDDATDLQHVKNEHCADKPGKSEWSEAFCTGTANLIEACTNAATRPAVVDGLNCFARGEEGEVVGQTSNGADTNCYKVVFEQAGFGKVELTTMFPVANDKC